MKRVQGPAPLICLTEGPLHHYFGYYDKRQFDRSGRYAVGLACNFSGRRQQARDTAEIGLIDMSAGCKWEGLCETRAWNWQFGCLAQWLPDSPNEIIYNDRKGDRFVSFIFNIEDGSRKEIPYPVFDINPVRRVALSVNFSRLAGVRPETGFMGGKKELPGSADDGIFSICLETGEKLLLVSLEKLASNTTSISRSGSMHYVTHPSWNRDGTRFLFWHRCLAEETSPRLYSAIYTADCEGKELFLLNEGNSHTAWKGREHVLAWSSVSGAGSHFYCFRDRTREWKIIGENVLQTNGHFTFSPDGRWLLTDTAVDSRNMRSILLYNWKEEYCVNAGSFYSAPSLTGELRCDLHPRWHPDGRRVCIDSVHEGSRQMYMLDAEKLMQGG